MNGAYSITFGNKFIVQVSRDINMEDLGYLASYVNYIISAIKSRKARELANSVKVPKVEELEKVK